MKEKHKGKEVSFLKHTSVLILSVALVVITMPAVAGMVEDSYMFFQGSGTFTPSNDDSVGTFEGNLVWDSVRGGSSFYLYRPGEESNIGPIAASGLLLDFVLDGAINEWSIYTVDENLNVLETVLDGTVTWSSFTESGGHEYLQGYALETDQMWSSDAFGNVALALPGFYVYGSASQPWHIAMVPEPMSMAMLGCLGAGMLGARKLKRKK